MFALILAARMAAIGPTKEIAPGVLMPRLSLGHPDDGSHTTANGTKAALLLWLSPQVGGAGIDTAALYQNQKQVGDAIRESGRARSSVFVTTKVPGAIGRQEALANLQYDLSQLGLAQVDLALIHGPCAKMEHGSCTPATDEQLQQTWLGLEDARKQGLARAIGVSNFAISDLNALLALNRTKPAINQCHMSVGDHDDATREFCQDEGIAYEAYSPLGRNGTRTPLNFSDPRIVHIAEAHNKSGTRHRSALPRRRLARHARRVRRSVPGVPPVDRAARLPAHLQLDQAVARPRRRGRLRL